MSDDTVGTDEVRAAFDDFEREITLAVNEGIGRLRALTASLARELPREPKEDSDAPSETVACRSALTGPARPS